MGDDLLPVVLPLVLLASGFIFLRTFTWTKHRWDALAWEYNLFESAIWGGALFLAARLGVPLVSACPFIAGVRGVIASAVPVPYTASLFFTIALGYSVALFLNVYVDRKWAIRRAVAKHGDELAILLQRAAHEGRPVMLSMDDRKVYVGLLQAAPGPKYAYTRLIPTISGYRDPLTLRVEFTTHYKEALEDEESQAPEDFGIVIPVTRIVSARLFDFRTYTRHFERRENQDPAQGSSGMS